MEHFDAIIIGFGKGGKTLAASLAKAGKQVAMIEQSAEQYGGTCINIACIPTKSLAFQSEQQAKSGESKEDYYQEAIQEKDQLTSTLRENNFKMLDDQETVTVYTAKATFIDDKKIRLRPDSESLELTADNFFINTGSSPIIPPLDGIDDTENVYTSTTLQERHELPEKLVIIGGGYIGLEFASMYANFGSKVTVIDSSEEFLPNDDRDIADKVQKIFEEKGITLQLESRVKSVKNKDGGVAVTYQRGDTAKEITGSALLVATGRKPNTEGLGIENTSVQMDDKGAIITDDYLKTNADHIWALGDVNGGPQFTYISLDDFRIVRDQLFDDGSYSKKQRKNIPYSVFIEPVLSHVGLNEKTAKEEGINYRAASIPAAGVPYARIVKQTDGLLKALIDPDTDEILGCTLFCAGSHELINTVRIAMEAKLPYTRLKDNIFTHPSMSEALNNLFSSFD